MLQGKLFLFGFPTLVASGVAVACYGYFENASAPSAPQFTPALYVDVAAKDFCEVPQGSVLNRYLL